jgi:glycosyltransferase involved in cell wall biosynthesis
MYAGTHGLSQGLDVILEAAKRTTNPDILYVLAGEGADKQALVRKAENEDIRNVRFLPNQPQASMPSVLNLAYATVLSLKPLPVFRSALPSKMFEAMAVGRPIAASVWGEAAGVIRAARCGVVAQPGDAAGLRAAVETIAADPAEARRMGLRGRDFAIEHFNRRKIATRLRRLLLDAASHRRSAEAPGS